jgi:hypothetical protein
MIHDSSTLNIFSQNHKSLIAHVVLPYTQSSFLFFWYHLFFTIKRVPKPVYDVRLDERNSIPWWRKKLSQKADVVPLER